MRGRLKHSIPFRRSVQTSDRCIFRWIELVSCQIGRYPSANGMCVSWQRAALATPPQSITRSIVRISNFILILTRTDHINLFIYIALFLFVNAMKIWIANCWRTVFDNEDETHKIRSQSIANQLISIRMSITSIIIIVQYSASFGPTLKQKGRRNKMKHDSCSADCRWSVRCINSNPDSIGISVSNQLNEKEEKNVLCASHTWSSRYAVGKIVFDFDTLALEHSKQ